MGTAVTDGINHSAFDQLMAIELDKGRKEYRISMDRWSDKEALLVVVS